MRISYVFLSCGNFSTCDVVAFLERLHPNEMFIIFSQKLINIGLCKCWYESPCKICDYTFVL